MEAEIESIAVHRYRGDPRMRYITKLRIAGCLLCVILIVDTAFAISRHWWFLSVIGFIALFTTLIAIYMLED